MVDQLQIPKNIQYYLNATVKDFIHNSSWSIPPCFARVFPNIVSEIQQIVIPVEDANDELI